MSSHWKLTYSDYQDSLKRFSSALKLQKSELVRDASIKRFEMTIELSWKLMKDFLKDNGKTCNSPKGCLSEAFSFGLIKDDPKWFEMMEDRNLSVHTYSEKFAEGLYSRLKVYLKLFVELEKSMKKYN